MNRTDQSRKSSDQERVIVSAGSLELSRISGRQIHKPLFAIYVVIKAKRSLGGFIRSKMRLKRRAGRRTRI